MLGAGRPFIVELVNPRSRHIPQELLTRIQVSHSLTPSCCAHLQFATTPLPVASTYPTRARAPCVRGWVPAGHDKQEEVNSRTKLIGMRDLQQIAKDETAILKDGEESKTKTYT
jgi:tRNA U54 and U55 pseudouridine synthase Pus10